MAEGDIEEVEAEIPVLAEIMKTEYRLAVRDVLASLPDDDESYADEAAIVALILARFRKLVFEKRRRARAEASVMRLLEHGFAMGMEGTGEANALSKARMRVAARNAVRELEGVTKLKVFTPSRKRDLKQAIRDWRRRQDDRRAAGEDRPQGGGGGGGAVAPDDEPEDEPQPAEEPVDASLRNVLLDGIGPQEESNSDVVSYHTTNVGIYLAALQRRAKSLQLVNPKDHRTTRFCNWVHGRFVSMDRAKKRLTSLAKAIRENDAAKLKRARPLLNQSKRSLAKRMMELGADTVIGVFRAHFVRVGLPPFHYRCRTVARPVFVRQLVA